MTEFEKYVKSDFGVGSTTLYDYKNSMTPMVLEEDPSFTSSFTSSFEAFFPFVS